MSETTTDEAKIIDAALDLAEEGRWGEVTLRDIGERAGLGLADVMERFSSKGEVLAAYGRQVDREVVRRAEKAGDEEDSVRDALFEVIMSRFDVMQPRKEAIRAIVETGSVDGAVLRSVLESQNFMLQAAGVSTEGLKGAVRMSGLTSLYASVLRSWLDDDDPGMAKTMAVLDRRLRRGEQTLRNVDGVLSACERLGDVVRSGLASFSRRGSSGGSGSGSMGGEDHDGFGGSGGGAGEAPGSPGGAGPSAAGPYANGAG